MPDQQDGASEGIRTAQVIGTLCLATDLGMGFPFEHGLQTTVIAMRICNRLELDHEVASETYYDSLLSHAGCTTDAHLAAEIFGSSMTENFDPVKYGSPREVLGGLLGSLPNQGAPALARAAQTARRLPRLIREQPRALSALCEVAGMLAEQTGAPGAVPDQLAHLLERWDGKGPLRRAKGDEIPLPMRIAHVAMDAALQRHLGGVEHAVRLIRERSGQAFDPDVATCVTANSDEILALEERDSVWEEALDLEPGPQRTLAGEEVDRGLAAMGRFADLVSPFFGGRSDGVAGLAATAAERCALDPDGVAAIRRAGFVHDLGRVAVHPRVWNKDGSLTADEWEQVRLHPYHTARVLTPSPFFAALAPVAAAHHERLDGSGYHRGSSGSELPLPARLLAAADAYHAMCEPRPYRDALEPDRAAEELAADANAGRLDPDAVRTVIEAAGQKAPRLKRPAGLTDREAEVVTMVARGLQTKQVARALGISAKTADRHIQNAYRKIGVSSRAAATLFAMEHGLLAWGELPIADEPAQA